MTVLRGAGGIHRSTGRRSGPSHGRLTLLSCGTGLPGGEPLPVRTLQIPAPPSPDILVDEVFHTVLILMNCPKNGILLNCNFAYKIILIFGVWACMSAVQTRR